MSLDRKADELKGKLARNAITATETITVRDRVNTLATAGGAIVVTMPPISETAGMIFSFNIISGTNAVTFVDNNNDSFDSGPFQALSIEDVNDALVVYSDGFKWHILSLDEQD